jgi:hypothetical protein
MKVDTAAPKAPIIQITKHGKVIPQISITKVV